MTGAQRISFSSPLYLLHAIRIFTFTQQAIHELVKRIRRITMPFGLTRRIRTTCSDVLEHRYGLIVEYDEAVNVNRICSRMHEMKSADVRAGKLAGD